MLDCDAVIHRDVDRVAPLGAEIARALRRRRPDARGSRPRCARRRPSASGCSSWSAAARPGTTASSGGRIEGDRARRRLRHPALPDHAGDLEADHAGVRQADDLLPAVHADDGGDPGDPAHHHAAGPGAVPAAAGRRLAVGLPLRVRRPGGAARPRRRVHHRRGLHRRGPRGDDPRRQHLLRLRARRAAQGAHGARRRLGLRLPRRRSRALRRRRVRRARARGLDRGEAGAAEVQLRRRRALLLRQRRRRDRAQRASRARAARSRSPTSTASTCGAASSASACSTAGPRGWTPGRSTR